MEQTFIFISAVIIVSLFLIRLYYRKQAKELSEKIAASVNITSDLEQQFQDRIIKNSDKVSFLTDYEDDYKRASRLSTRLDWLHANTPETLVQFVTDYECIDSIVNRHNKQVEKNILSKNEEFFDTCLKYPLDIQQRKSIIADEDNILIVSSAGSGKTSTIIGKVKYLTERLHVSPEKILLISYTNKAANELTLRTGVNDLKGYTFHKLALEIIGNVTGNKPSICDNTDTLFVNIYHRLIKDKSFRKSVLSYFVDHNHKKNKDKQKRERLSELAESKSNVIKAFFPDMDGNIIYVHSEQESKICFALTALGVKFRYEEPYEYPLTDERHGQYRPDFSIYYETDGELHRLYLEHFGVDQHGNVPEWFAKDKGITYDEANKAYGDGITWKIEAHKKFGTKMVSTSSADFHFMDIKDKLKSILKEAGVPINEKTDEELYDLVLPPRSKREKTFIRLTSTFITLLKSRCENIKDVLRDASGAGDERSEFVIKEIFMPVYEEYTRELEKRKQIDFTDAILKATQLCKEKQPVNYEYIIVDEFQDISIDRYHFLQALRESKTHAKLFCVGDDWQSIYRFSGSDMALFSKFEDYFGATDIRMIETTYRFGEPLISLSSKFIQRNNAQFKKNIRPFNKLAKTELLFQPYERSQYVMTLEGIIRDIPQDKSIFLLGRYSFDDYNLSLGCKSIKEGGNFYYEINGRKIEFLTVHKSKGLEADYVILLQCNKGIFGFPSQINDDPALQYVLSGADQYPYGEERRLFYVAITRAKVRTYVMYDVHSPSLFVNEFLHPKSTGGKQAQRPNAQKKWTHEEEITLLELRRKGESITDIANKLGRSNTAIRIRLDRLGTK